MQIVIDVPIPSSGQDIINIPIHYCGGQVVDAGGYGFEERKTGKWIRFVGHPGKWICSNCGRNRLGQQFYCEWCGAKMEFTKW